jgi:hypothetical protein
LSKAFQDFIAAVNGHEDAGMFEKRQVWDLIINEKTFKERQFLSYLV